MTPSEDNEQQSGDKLILTITLTFVTVVMIYLFIKIVFL